MKSPRGSNQKPSKLSRGLLMFGTVVAAYLLLGLLNLDKVLLYAYLDSTYSQQAGRPAVWLRDYKVSIESKPLNNVEDNLSGLSFSPHTDSFWAVVNSPQELISLSADLEPVKTFRLPKHRDVEAVANVSECTLIVVDEKDLAITTLNICKQKDVSSLEASRKISLNKGGKSNRGWEGAAINHAAGIIYLANEKRPRNIISLKGFLSGSGELEFEEIFEFGLANMLIGDISGLYFDELSQNLLVLSHETKVLAEYDLQGNLVSYMALQAGSAGLSADIPQAEGVSMDSERNIVIVSEPNLVYKFTRVQHD